MFPFAQLKLTRIFFIFSDVTIASVIYVESPVSDRGYKICRMKLQNKVSPKKKKKKKKQGVSKKKNSPRIQDNQLERVVINLVGSVQSLQISFHYRSQYDCYTY